MEKFRKIALLALVTALFALLSFGQGGIAKDLNEKRNSSDAGRNEFAMTEIASPSRSRAAGSLTMTEDEDYYSSRLESLNITLIPGSLHRRDSSPTPITSRKCKTLVYKTLLNLPSLHRNQLSQLTLFYTKDGRRGLGGNGSVVLRCLNVTDEELSAVLVHEIGHLVDSSLLIGTNGQKSAFYDFDVPVLTDDYSLPFYQISWLTDKKSKNDSVSLDFVSLYAMTDPFEDFAETYTYYRLHGSEFRRIAELNDRLKAKYDFMRLFVFDGQEFGYSNTATSVNYFQRNYDVTVLPYSLKEFLG